MSGPCTWVGLWVGEYTVLWKEGTNTTPEAVWPNLIFLTWNQTINDYLINCNWVRKKTNTHAHTYYVVIIWINQNLRATSKWPNSRRPRFKRDDHSITMLTNKSNSTYITLLLNNQWEKRAITYTVCYCDVWWKRILLYLCSELVCKQLNVWNQIPHKQLLVRPQKR